MPVQRIDRKWLDYVAFAALLLCAVFADRYFTLPRLQFLLSEFFSAGYGRAMADSDFVNYWQSARLALSGNHMILFDVEAYGNYLNENGFPTPRNWSYPPHAILLYLPLGFFDFKHAFILFLAATLALYILACLHFYRRYASRPGRLLLTAGLLCFVTVNVAAAQNGFLTAALMLLFLTEWDRRPLLSAICLAVLTTKPQLGVLIPFFLIFANAWRVIFLAGFLALLLAALSAAWLGMEAWFAFLAETIPYQTALMFGWDGVFLRMMPSIVPAFRILGLPAETGANLQLAWSVAMACLCAWWMWRSRDADPAARAFLLLLSTFLVLPYSFSYDMGALVAAAAIVLINQHWRVTWRMLAVLPIPPLPVLLVPLGYWQWPIGLPILVLSFCMFLLSLGGQRQPDGTGVKNRTEP